jgi:hypothetical protein
MYTLIGKVSKMVGTLHVGMKYVVKVIVTTYQVCFTQIGTETFTKVILVNRG